MPMNKTMRIFSIVQTLNQEPGTSAHELAVKHGISERSVYRYLKELKVMGFVLHPVDNEEGDMRKRALAPLTFTGAEALAFVAACQSLLSQQGIPFCSSLKTALQKVEGALCSWEDKRTYLRMQSHFTYLNATLRDHTPWQDIIETINTSIRRNRTITAIYDSFSADEVTERLMDPYDLFFRDGNLYLAAYCHKRQSVCNFRIDRFKGIKSVNGQFVRDHSFNLKEFLGSSWRVWHGSQKATVKFIVYPPASRFFRESTYHDSQKTEELEGGQVLCSLTVYITPEIKSWLLSWGKQIKLLEPLELVEKIKDELRESLIVYE